MSEEWINVFASSKIYEIELLRCLLLDNDIESFVLNKQDSVYLIGDIELMVYRDDFLKAKHIINKFNNIE